MSLLGTLIIRLELMLNRLRYLGASYEKHFTKDKNYSSFRDHKISADPDEFSKMVNLYVSRTNVRNWRKHYSIP